MKTWKPDTCECTVEELYEGTEIIGMGQVVKKCAVHASVPDSELYDTILNGENRVKNIMEAEIVNDPDFGEEVDTDEVDETATAQRGTRVMRKQRRLKQGLRYDWSFTGTGKDRKLVVDVKGATLTKAKRDSLKAKASVLFGAAKVDLK